jgi:hypothetical protein
MRCNDVFYVQHHHQAGGITPGGGSDQSPPSLRRGTRMALYDDDANEEKGYKTSIGMDKRATVHREEG